MVQTFRCSRALVRRPLGLALQTKHPSPPSLLEKRLAVQTVLASCRGNSSPTSRPAVASPNGADLISWNTSERSLSSGDSRCMLSQNTVSTHGNDSYSSGSCASCLLQNLG